MQLRANGHDVYGFGERKTPDPFANACTTFLYLDRLGEEDNPVGKAEPAPPPVSPRRQSPPGPTPANRSPPSRSVRMRSLALS
ncbi:hypothetical protein [uncultured Sphingomonas sp.]|uniref:hypothetical protein n=1 Tax=uncultured Sphingomonas sp. TaxID=158754 RepID=UPI0025E51A21|nr:hypothetical protein [uncultured Sphingomonas sp.]